MVEVMFGMWYGVVAGTIFGYTLGNPSTRSEVSSLTVGQKFALAFNIALWPIFLPLVGLRCLIRRLLNV